MYGEKINCVNKIMRDLLSDMKEISENSADFAVKLAVMAFADRANWITPFPVAIENYIWNDVAVNKESKICVLGEACELLNEKLSTSEDGFLQDKVGNLPPAIILLSDGGATDDFYSGLDKLKQNKWFKHAMKAAIGIGSDYDKNILADFTGSSELVVDVENAREIKRWFRHFGVRIGVRKGALIHPESPLNFQTDEEIADDLFGW